jgi:hypothetical protein
MAKSQMGKVPMKPPVQADLIVIRINHNRSARLAQRGGLVIHSLSPERFNVSLNMSMGG